MDKLLTNFDNTKLPKFEKALKLYREQTKNMSIYISKVAFWPDGTRDHDMSSLRTSEDKDLSRFWRIFDSLKWL